MPWLQQWHNERELGFTLGDLRAWRPVVLVAKRGRKKKHDNGTTCTGSSLGFRTDSARCL